jgi:hypothetical protein
MNDACSSRAMLQVANLIQMDHSVVPPIVKDTLFKEYGIYYIDMTIYITVRQHELVLHVSGGVQGVRC